jgi:hypothetical protein
MSRGTQVLISIFVTVTVVTLVRLILPYGISESKNVLPVVYSAGGSASAEPHLATILEYNLWEEGRAPLRVTNNRAGADQSASEAAAIALALDEKASRLRLTGISRGEGEVFAVIESSASTERYTLGEMLPDGSRLEEILEYGVRISKSGSNERLYLFGKN